MAGWVTKTSKYGWLCKNSEYDRKPCSDKNKECQNTRHALLISSSSAKVTYKIDKQCNVLLGYW